jgi:hypothetical protein
MKTNTDLEQSRQEHEASIIANAVRFDVSLFLGVGRYDKLAVTTYALAEVAARILAKRNPDCSRRPMIYATDQSGRSALVPNSKP